jgi:hypothetical protein
MINIIGDEIVCGLYKKENMIENIKAFCQKLKEVDIHDYIYIINVYLTEVIFKYFYFLYETQYNISIIDILNNNICKNKVTFSGTVNFNLPSDVISILDNNILKSDISKIQYKLSILDIVYYKITNNMYEPINRTFIFEELQKYANTINETTNYEIEKQEVFISEPLSNIKTIDSEMNILKKNLKLIVNKLKIYNIEEKNLVLMFETFDTFSNIFPCEQNEYIEIIKKFKMFYICILKLYYVIDYNIIEKNFIKYFL